MRRYRGATDLLAGFAVMVLFFSPLSVLGQDLARVVCAALAGPDQMPGELAEAGIFFVGAGIGAAGACLLGLLAARSIRCWQDRMADSRKKPDPLGVRALDSSTELGTGSRVRPRFAIARLSARRVARRWAGGAGPAQADRKTSQRTDSHS